MILKLSKEKMKLVSGGNLIGFIIYLPKNEGSPQDYYQRLAKLIPAIKSGLSHFNFLDIDGNPVTVDHFFKEPIISIIKSTLKSQNESENKAIAYVIDDLYAEQKNIITIYS